MFKIFYRNSLIETYQNFTTDVSYNVKLPDFTNFGPCKQTNIMKNGPSRTHTYA